MEGEWRQYKDAFVGVAGSCVAEPRRKEVHRYAETNDGGRKRWRMQWVKRKAWTMIDGIRDRGEQPPTGLRHLCG